MQMLKMDESDFEEAESAFMLIHITQHSIILNELQVFI